MSAVIKESYVQSMIHILFLRSHSPLQFLADYHALSRAKARLHTPFHGGKSIAAISSLYPFMADILAVALQGLKLIQQKEVISPPQTVRICRQLYSQQLSNWQKFKLAN